MEIPRSPFVLSDPFGFEGMMDADGLGLVQPHYEQAAAEMETRQDILREAQSAWDGLAGFRATRRTLRDVKSGRQYFQHNDADTGELVDEAEEIRGQNRIPWVINKARPIIRHLKGQYRQNASERVPFAVNNDDQQVVGQLVEAYRAVRRRNRSRIIEADGFEEHVLSGLFVERLTEEYIPSEDRNDIKIDSVHSSMVFFNRDIVDRRFEGLRIIGQAIDAPIEEVLMRFAPDDRGQREVLKAIYAEAKNFVQGGRGHDFDFGMLERQRYDGADFLMPHTMNLCRVIEAWRLEGREMTFIFDPMTGAQGTAEEFGYEPAQLHVENMNRQIAGEPAIDIEQKYEQVWVYYFLTPLGHVLATGVTPYWHQGHPFAMTMAGYVDGEIYGLLADIVDPQRMLNRLYTQIDHMIGTSARGLWMVPEDSIPDGMAKEEFADEVTKIGNMLFYKPNNNPSIKPEVITQNAVPVSIFTFLEQQLGFIDNIGGITGALQGVEPPPGTPAALHNQLVQQGNTGTADLFETWFEGINEADVKLVSLILQFYNEERAIKAGPGSAVFNYNPQQVRALEYDVAMGRVSDTALYRQLFEGDLKEFMAAGRISFRQYLAESQNPRAQALMSLIDRTNPLLAGAAGPEAIPALVEAAQAGDLDAAATLLQFQEAGGFTGASTATQQQAQAQAA